MADPADYPPDPQHWPPAANGDRPPDHVTPNFVYPDGSGHCFDLPPRYVLWDEGGLTHYSPEWREGGFYDLPELHKLPAELRFAGWTNWCDKIQKDYRFAALSDFNARATVFPNVHDPWQFTEYVFRGTGRTSDREDAAEKGSDLVAPPLFLPVGFARTHQEAAPGEWELTGSTGPGAGANDAPAYEIPLEHQPQFTREHRYRSEAGGGEYWEGELAAMGWVEHLPGGAVNRRFRRLEATREVARYAVPKTNSRVRLYPRDVWSRSERWGQSGNIPPQTLTHTAPAGYLERQDVPTGRIVPTVVVEWGVPIYDNCTPATGPQAVRYDGYGSTANGRIYLWPRSVDGPDGDPGGVFAYAPPPAPPDDSGNEVSMPRENLEALNWNPPAFTQGDLIHRGCQFWEGRVDAGGGGAECAYYRQFADQFAARETVTIEFGAEGGAQDVPFGRRSFGAVDPDAWKVVVRFTDGTRTTTAEKAGLQVQLHGPEDGESDEVHAVTLLTPGGATLYPARGEGLGGVFDDPQGPVTATLEVLPRNSPSPSPRCGLYVNPDGGGASGRDEAVAGFRAAGGTCPYYTPVGRRVLGSYTVQASNGSEWANMQRGLPPGYRVNPIDTQYGQTMLDFAGASGGLGVGSAAAIGYGLAGAAITPDPFTGGLEQDEYRRVRIEWRPETLSVGGKERYYDTPDGRPRSYLDAPEADLRVRAATGRRTFDRVEGVPLSGTDSIFFDQVNQINYRLLASVQHCYDPELCDPIIHDPAGNVGWRRGFFGGVDFTGHPLRPPGYPGGDGSAKHCFTGNGLCPKGNLDRRAEEYRENYQVLVDEIAVPFRSGGVAAFARLNHDGGSVDGLVERFLDGQGVVRDLGEEAYYQTPEAWSWTPVAARLESGDPPLLGHWHPTATDDAGGVWRLFFFYELPSFVEGHARSRLWAHLVQFDDEDHPAYTPLAADDPRRDFLAAVYGDPDAVPWLVELDPSYEKPHGNLIAVTNPDPFAGGRHPEYKDHSLRDREVVCTRGGYEDRSFAEGRTDSNQYGGPLWNVSPVKGTVKQGYWVEADGRWITEGAPVGADAPIVEPRPRMLNKPPRMGHAVPVEGRPGTTLIDNLTPEYNRDGGWASTGATYSNDTKASLDYIRSIWELHLPDDPNDPDGGKLWINPPSPNEDMLPRERFWYRCDVCGIDFSEEEAQFWSLRRNADGTPAHPAPAGGDGLCGCPRGDGGALVDQGGSDRFIDCHARGVARVWAPPGTTVRHDAFYWKAPPLISRAHQLQLLRKLGRYNPTGGGYGLTDVREDTERYGRLPVNRAAPHAPGLSRTLLYPPVAPGQSVADARAAVAGDYGLEEDDQDPARDDPDRRDVAWLRRLNAPLPVRVARADEASTALAAGDTVTFLRGVAKPRLVGLPVTASTPLAASLAEHPLVREDRARHPRPQRGSYPPGDEGRRRYEHALREWLISPVEGSTREFSSTQFLLANALAAKLASGGIDGSVASPIDPDTGEALDVDDRVISADPRAGGLGAGALGQITLAGLKRLRNRLLPMLAYSLRDPTHTAGGDFDDSAQAHNNDRFRSTRKPLEMPVQGTIPPQVMAATSTGRDYFVEWDLGDVLGTKARAYYPVGTTWWRMNQRIGEIRRSGGTNRLHLDDAETDADGNYLHEEYTGDRITSTVTYFLHGRVPMDKEVERALLLFAPGDGPSMSAVGCQGQYTGDKGRINPLTGEFFEDQFEYVGHGYCFWQHWHPFTTNHEADAGSFTALYFDGAGSDLYAGFAGYASKLHADGHPREFFERRGTLGGPDGGDNPPTHLAWELELAADPEQGNTSIYDGWYSKHRPWLWGDSDNNYSQMILPVSALNYVEKHLGFEYDLPAGDERRQRSVRGTWSPQYEWGQQVEFLQDEFENWKPLSLDGYLAYADRYRCDAYAQVGVRHKTSFTYYGSLFREVLWPWAHSPVPGLIDLTGYDNAGRFSRHLEIASGDGGMTTLLEDPALLDGEPIVIEGPRAPAVTPPPGGGNGRDQAGSASRVLDITDRIKELYNDRVDRYFDCRLGHPYASLFPLVRDGTDTNLGLHEPFHLGDGRDPDHFWNYRYLRGTDADPTRSGVWLTDPWHHPETDAAGDPLNTSPEGDALGRDPDGRIEQVTGWDDSEDADPDAARRYHPESLLLSDTPGFAPGAPAWQNPVPADGLGLEPDRYWRVTRPDAHGPWFVASLLGLPLERSRRNWRFEPPRVDSTSALCPNPSCFVSENGWTVGQFLSHATGTWGFGVIPSTGSPWCANCGTELVGYDELDGDGILTVDYDEPPVDDALVGAIELDVLHPLEDPLARHGVVVEYQHSRTPGWRTLLSIRYDEADGLFHYRQWDGSAWQQVATPELPAVFRGTPGVGGTPADPGAAAGCHFTVVAARRLRVRVPRPAGVTRTEPAAGGWRAAVPDPARRRVRVAALDHPTATYLDGTVVLADDGGGEIRATVNAVEEVSEDQGGEPVVVGYDLKLTVTAGQLGPDHTRLRAELNRYLSRVTRFRVFGHRHAEGEVTVTPPAPRDGMPLSTGVDSVALEARPSRIEAVRLYAGDGIEVDAAEADDPRAAEFLWEVAPDHFDGRPFLQVVGGRWFYDWAENKVVVPSAFRDPADGRLRSIWELNADLYAAEEALPIKTLPSRVEVQYLTGLGVASDVAVAAEGPGPSYQLEAESVCFVADAAGNGADLPGAGSSLPAVGDSVRLARRGGLRRPMQWHCYNHQRLVWEPQVGWLVGDELPAGGWGDHDVANLFTGRHGDNLSDLGPGSPVGGTVEGAVTLYGASETLISGDLKVCARATTRRVYGTGNGQTVETYERTGGFRSGMFTFRLGLGEVTDGRKSISAAVPQVLIYLRERDLGEPT